MTTDKRGCAQMGASFFCIAESSSRHCIILDLGIAIFDLGVANLDF